MYKTLLQWTVYKYLKTDNKIITFAVDCVWGKWKSSECSKAGEQELTREVEIPETLFGEACQGPDHKAEKCEMPKGMKTKLFI